MICGKQIYSSQLEAVKAIKGHYNDRRTNPNSSRRKRINLESSYFCKDCNGWHVFTSHKTSNSRFRKQQIANKHPLFEKAPKPMEYLVIHSKMKIK